MRLIQLLLLTAVGVVHGIGLLSIDYGTESCKAAFVGLGKSLDIVYNKDSKRKTAAVITLKDRSEKFVGGEAASLATRFPAQTYHGLKLLLDSDTSDLYHASNSPANNFDHWSLQELLAFQFLSVKESITHTSVYDSVLTIPNYFNQSQRQVLLDAADLAGFKNVELLHDGSAVAVNYAINRLFEKPERHLFYDVGASATQATLVEFSTVPSTSGVKNKNATQVLIKGTGYSKSVGGLQLDLQVRQLLLDAFNEQHGSKVSIPIVKNDRAMAKLLKEANRVKHVLSANAAAISRIENLAEDIDFKTTVTRDSLEAGITEYYQEGLEKPIHDALTQAGMTIEQVDSVVLVGGSTRVPYVQARLKTVVPEAKLAFNLNADESAVMGAALQAAAASPQFKTKEIVVVDKIDYNVALAYEASTGAKEKVEWKKGLGQDDVLEIAKQREDFVIDATSSPSHLPLFRATISGLAKALENRTEEEINESMVKIYYSLSRSGILRIDRATFQFPEQSTSIADKIKNLFSSSNKTEEEIDALPPLNETAATNVTNETESSIPKKPKQPSTVRLYVDYDYISIKGLKPMSASDKVGSRKKIKDLELQETKKKKREEARNGLEGYLYKIRDLIESSIFGESSTENERTKLKEVLDETTDWLWTEAETALTKDLKSKRADLEKLVKPVQTRIDEAQGRIGAISALQSTLQKADEFYKVAQEGFAQQQKTAEQTWHTLEELTKLQDLLKMAREWFETGKAKQDKLPAYMDAVLKKLDLTKKTKDITTEIEKLAKKRKPRKSKATSSSTEAESSTSSSDSAESRPTKDEL